MQIAEHTVVSIRYRMKNSRGEVLENTLNSTPINYLHGAGSILPALETNLVGLRPGDEKEVFLSRDQGHGQLDDDFYIRVIIDGVRLATAAELSRGSADPFDCGPDCQCYQ